MNFAQLRAFNAVAIHRTFSTAAQSLGISQSAITQNIKSLEDSVGTRLFNRTASGIELTASAYDLLPKVREVVLALDDLGSSFGKSRDLRTGYLSLGLCAPYVAMPILERFSARYPDVSLNIRLDNSSNLLKLVARHRVDVAIATLLEPEPDFVCEKLVDQQVLILVHAAHPWWNAKHIAMQDLQGQSFIMREEGSMTRQIFERALSQLSIQISTRLVLGSREAVKEAVATGLGLGIVLNQEMSCDPRLKGIPVKGADMSAGEYLITLPGIRNRGAIREFFATAQEVVDRSDALSQSHSDVAARNS